MQTSRKEVSELNTRVAGAIIAAVAVTLAMAVVPVLMTSTTVVQSASAQSAEELIPDVDSLIEQYSPTPNLPTPNLPTPNLPTPNLPTPNLPTPNLPTPGIPSH